MSTHRPCSRETASPSVPRTPIARAPLARTPIARAPIPRAWAVLFAIAFAVSLLFAGAGCTRSPAPGEAVTYAGEGAGGGDCGALEGMLRDLKTESAQLRTRLQTAEAETDTLRNRAVRASTQIRDLNTAIRDLRLKEKAIHSYIVRDTENLRDIARTVWGDPTLWREIYEANRDQIESENAPLRPGMRLAIPRRDRS